MLKMHLAMFYLVLYGLYGLELRRAFGQECKKRLSNYFDKINFFPVPVRGPLLTECFWTFEPPENKEYILLMEFNYLSAYEADDEIFLPDGNILPKQVIYRGGASVCRLFVIPETAVLSDCVSSISEMYCPRTSATISRIPLRLYVKTLARSEIYPNEYHYTNFQVAYTFYFCNEREALQQEPRDIAGLTTTTIAPEDSPSATGVLSVILILCLFFISVLLLVITRIVKNPKIEPTPSKPLELHQMYRNISHEEFLTHPQYTTQVHPARSSTLTPPSNGSELQFKDRRGSSRSINLSPYIIPTLQITSPTVSEVGSTRSLSSTMLPSKMSLQQESDVEARLAVSNVEHSLPVVDVIESTGHERTVKVKALVCTRIPCLCRPGVDGNDEISSIASSGYETPPETFDFKSRYRPVPESRKGFSPKTSKYPDDSFLKSLPEYSSSFPSNNSSKTSKQLLKDAILNNIIKKMSGTEDSRLGGSPLAERLKRKGSSEDSDLQELRRQDLNKSLPRRLGARSLVDMPSDSSSLADLKRGFKHTISEPSGKLGPAPPSAFRNDLPQNRTQSLDRDGIKDTRNSKLTDDEAADYLTNVLLDAVKDLYGAQKPPVPKPSQAMPKSSQLQVPKFVQQPGVESDVQFSVKDVLIPPELSRRFMDSNPVSQGMSDSTLSYDSDIISKYGKEKEMYAPRPDDSSYGKKFDAELRKKIEKKPDTKASEMGFGTLDSLSNLKPPTKAESESTNKNNLPPHRSPFGSESKQKQDRLSHNIPSQDRSLDDVLTGKEGSTFDVPTIKVQRQASISSLATEESETISDGITLSVPKRTSSKTLGVARSKRRSSIRNPDIDSDVFNKESIVTITRPGISSETSVTEEIPSKPPKRPKSSSENTVFKPTPIAVKRTTSDITFPTNIRDFRKFLDAQLRRGTYPLVTIPPSMNPSRTAKRVSLHDLIETGAY